MRVFSKEEGIILCKEIQFKTPRHKPDNLMLIAFKNFFGIISFETFNFNAQNKVIKE